LLRDYDELDYETIILPKVPVSERAGVVLEQLAKKTR